LSKTTETASAPVAGAAPATETAPKLRIDVRDGDVGVPLMNRDYL
jgi:hypothetical protein